MDPTTCSARRPTSKPSRPISVDAPNVDAEQLYLFNVCYGALLAEVTMVRRANWYRAAVHWDVDEQQVASLPSPSSRVPTLMVLSTKGPKKEFAQGRIHRVNATYQLFSAPSGHNMLHAADRGPALEAAGRFHAVHRR
jgi:hypothetical protein